MDGRNRNDVTPGIEVAIVLKNDQYFSGGTADLPSPSITIP